MLGDWLVWFIETCTCLHVRVSLRRPVSVCESVNVFYICKNRSVLVGAILVDMTVLFRVDPILCTTQIETAFIALAQFVDSSFSLNYFIWNMRSRPHGNPTELFNINVLIMCYIRLHTGGISTTSNRSKVCIKHYEERQMGMGGIKMRQMNLSLWIESYIGVNWMGVGWPGRGCRFSRTI